MDTIIANNISNIAISTKMVIFGKDGTNTKIDISKMFQNEDDAYIEVTSTTKAHGKRFTDWTRLQDTQEYIKELEDILNIADVRCLNKSHNIGVSEKSDKMRCLENNKNSKKAKVNSKLIIRKAGRYGGTYLHKKLALKYFRWLDRRFEIELDMFLEKVYKQITVIKMSRMETKSKFRPLADAIESIFIPAQINPTLQKYGSQYIMNLINLKVLGVTARQFKEINGLDPEANIHTRDYLSDDELKNIVRFQQHLHSFLVAGITDYQTLRNLINNIPL